MGREGEERKKREIATVSAIEPGVYPFCIFFSSQYLIHLPGVKAKFYPFCLRMIEGDIFNTHSHKH